MEKIWIRKDLYILNYEFMKFYAFFQFFYLIFIYIFLIKIRKKGILLTCRVTWRAAADVARGTTSRCDAALRPRGRAREGRHVAGRFAHGGPTGIVGPW